ncbi:MAG: hypothetical protein ACOYOP_01420 [Microthrixaceae bacterium]
MNLDRRADAPTALGIVRGLDPYVLLALTPFDEEVEVAVRPLPPDDRCGAAMLLGLEAPPGATTVAASFVGSTAERPAGQGEHTGQRHRIDVAVDRWGEVASSLRLLRADGTPGDDEPAAAATPEGLVVDALHRVLDLPSPGDPPALTELVTAMWTMCMTSHLLGAAAPTWAEVAALHPAGDESVGDGLPDGADTAVPPSPEALAAATRRLTADGTTWERLRRATVIGRFPAPELSPEEAAWMDHTMYGRWYVQSYPSAEFVAGRLRSCGATAAASGVEQVARLLA